MKCFKCNGVMVREKFYDIDGDCFNGWRCVNCGKIIDPLIMENSGMIAVQLLDELDAMMHKDVD